jgi:predicted acyl esterase
LPIEKGKITYYALYKNAWETSEYIEDGETEYELFLNNQKLDGKMDEPCEITYTYNPYNPAYFNGGVCHGFGGMQKQTSPNSSYDIISFESDPFQQGRYVKGKMKATLYVKSDCEDTCFYIHISIVKRDGNIYSLRDDIHSLCYQLGDYVPNSEARMEFNFTEHAFMIEVGDKLRVDVSSSAANCYVPHTNKKGLYSKQTTAKIAHNTIICGKSSIVFYAD